MAFSSCKCVLSPVLPSHISIYINIKYRYFPAPHSQYHKRGAEDSICPLHHQRNQMLSSASLLPMGARCRKVAWFSNPQVLFATSTLKKTFL